MEHLTPQVIAEITGGRYIGDEVHKNVRIAGAVRDNRDVKPGNLFVCIRGARVDGHTFANSAFEAGAACCLAEQEIADAKGPYVLVESTLMALRKIGGYHRRLFNIPVIGITGSVGKTTTKEMAAAVLEQKFRVLKTGGNLNNDIGVPLTLLSLDESHEAAVIEMGISDFGDMNILTEMVRPNISILTKIGYAHLENLGDLNGVLRAKTEIYNFMSPDATAIVNGDDELLWTHDPGIRRLTYGLDPRNDVRAENIRTEGTDAVTCDIVGSAGRFPIKIPAFGSHLVLAALPAVMVGQMLGMTDAEIAQGLLSYAPVGGRANVTNTGFVTLIDDCYNANPSSVKEALQSLSALTGRRVAILGDMLELGEKSDDLHREIGVFAGQSGIDLLICCGEQAELIREGFLFAAGDAEKRALHFPEKAELIEMLPELIKKDDNVLIKASNGMQFDEISQFLKEK